MSEINLYYQPNVPHIAKEKYGGFAEKDTNGKVVLTLVVEETAVPVVLEERDNIPQPPDTIPQAILQLFLQQKFRQVKQWVENWCQYLSFRIQYGA